MSRTLAGAEADARDALAARLRTAPTELEVSVEPVVPEISDRLEEALRLSEEADALRAAAADAWREVAVTLTAELNISQQDAATVMGISRQRVGQLLQDTDGRGRRRR